eukprot:TRINITY_DN4990_c0_g1_i2.p1 TRINITY_DN4990_c0_g1~~TRINITY_DN4990_c0_g1_i2.p1  ORF type:complete len:342 (-),score=53.93 TRINITY_DN4990_c0_g1_i2:73-1098(-)
MSDELQLTHDGGMQRHGCESNSNSSGASAEEGFASISPDTIIQVEGPDVLRSRVRNTLLQASKDGRLGIAMGHKVSTRKKTERLHEAFARRSSDADVRRLNAPECADSVLPLPSGQAVGHDELSLSDELPVHAADVRGPSPHGAFAPASPAEQHALLDHELRAHAIHAMLQAAADGTLASALLAVSQQHSEQAEVAPLDELYSPDSNIILLVDDQSILESDDDQQVANQQFVQVHDLERHASDQMMATAAATDGEPRHDQGDISLEALRVQTADTLLRAVADGTLQSALEAIRSQHEVHEDNPIDGLRVRAANTLVQAAFNGTLMSALSAIRPKSFIQRRP